MALTRAAIEKTLLTRARKRMEFVGMSIVSNGINADLNDPIATALQQMGIAPADFTNVQDSDFISVAQGDTLRLLDLAELRLLENINGNVDAVDVSDGPRSARYSQFKSALEKDIQRRLEAVRTNYGMALGSLQAGVISLDFQEGEDNA